MPVRETRLPSARETASSLNSTLRRFRAPGYRSSKKSPSGRIFFPILRSTESCSSEVVAWPKDAGMMTSANSWSSSKSVMQPSTILTLEAISRGTSSSLLLATASIDGDFSSAVTSNPLRANSYATRPVPAATSRIGDPVFRA